MAYGLNSGPFQLKDYQISIGVWTTPHLIGVGTIDPLSLFTGDIVGYVRQGSLKINLARQYAEWLSNTPGGLIRKDLIRKQFSIEFTEGQFTGELRALMQGLYSQLAYAVTTPTSKTLDLSFVGPDEPTQAAFGWLLSSQRTDGKNTYRGVWSGKLTTEDISEMTSGTDYAVLNGKIEAFEDSNFTGALARQKNYGLFWDDIS